MPGNIGLWRAGKVELWVERVDSVWLEPTLDEAVATEVFAEIGPLVGGVQISVMGYRGQFQAFRVDGCSTAHCDRVARCWVEVVARRFGWRG
jgi:hypothetical protein